MVAAALSSFLLVANAAALDNGAAAPDFSVISGEGQRLALEDIKDRAALVLYETRETKEDNRELKNALNKLYAQNSELGKASIVLSVIDCSGAAWPFKGIWRKELAKNSEKEKITIYGDWDGK
ncbi:MAG TPA: hypothetical protein PLL10_08400, partial [Elusimicrobiales bacterium]|nr:hypothetical protein [Elusimicrobiales bacterium]